MSRNNGTRHETAFTVSIEAREGVTTGISPPTARAPSRSRSTHQEPDDIVTPGHVFPLVAREGGVLVRAGHTEAAVDISRLAGLNPSGVICEIMNDDGTMARMDDLIAFAQPARSQDRHDPRPDRLSPQARPHGRKRAAAVREPLGRRLDAPPSTTRPPGTRRSRWSRAGSTPTSRRWCGCTRCPSSPTSSANTGDRAGLLTRSMEMIARKARA
jgi:hypothetical protein